MMTYQEFQKKWNKWTEIIADLMVECQVSQDFTLASLCDNESWEAASQDYWQWARRRDLAIEQRNLLCSNHNF